ncbi:MAG TPA: type II toxin-antitoxin system PemK/MazF family toxin [Propionibacteriaceae bacterium]|nr:type II toxin-antitoxin system PemK/MazF family toxin [Propionibacteriaceae bacterium]
MRLDKTRPALILTREIVRPHLSRVTVAPITSRVRGLTVEVPVGQSNGLDQDSVINCDNIVTIPTSAVGRQIGFLWSEQEPKLSEAVRAAFDLWD